MSETSDFFKAKTPSQSSSSSTSTCSSSMSGTPALKRSMASASSTEGEKKICLERISSSGSAWQAAQEAGLAEAAAACFAPRQRKHARCRSPGAREPGQEEQDNPGRGSAPERTGPEKG